MKNRNVKVNVIMNALLTMSSFIFPLITFPYVSRILLPVGTGKVSFATSLVSYFTMISQLGIPTYGIRACAKVRDNKMELSRITHELLFINFTMSILSYLLLIAAIVFVPRLREERALYIVVGSTIILTAIGMEWLYKALTVYLYNNTFYYIQIYFINCYVFSRSGKRGLCCLRWNNYFCVFCFQYFELYQCA